MLRRAFLCVFLAISSSAILRGSSSASAEPNIILITLGSTRADRMGFLDSRRALTPHLDALAKQVPQWKVVDGHHITRAFTFPDFRQALTFVNKVGELAEEQGHHPDILLSWGRAEITTWTHKINGLSEGDFILAAKIDKF